MSLKLFIQCEKNNELIELRNKIDLSNDRIFLSLLEMDDEQKDILVMMVNIPLSMFACYL